MLMVCVPASLWLCDSVVVAVGLWLCGSVVAAVAVTVAVAV